MSQLLKRGMIAALAPAGVPNSDIIVTDQVGNKLCAIQVKTRREKGSDGGWHMKKKHEDIISDSIFYCFVDFGKTHDQAPKCWIVPSLVVANALKEAHKTWLSMPGKGGKAHNDGEMRRFKPDYDNLGLSKKYGKGWLDKYLEAWQLVS